MHMHIVYWTLSHSLSDAFTPESELALQLVLEDLALPFPVSPFQEFATNALLNRVDVVGILPTGSGKTLVFYLFSLALRKLPPGYKSIPPSVSQGGLVLVSMPLSMLIQAQLSNPYGCKVASLSMAAEVSGTVCQAKGLSHLRCAGELISDAELVANNNFLLLFFHPEAIDDEKGRKLLRDLSRKGRIGGLLIDEVHLGLA